jgi:ATP-dependent Clp protease ATP-binding subunit ClpA
LKIVNQQIEQLKSFLDKKGIELQITQECCEKIAQKGFSEEFGAREIERVIEHEIKDKLIDIVLIKKEQGKKIVFCDIDENDEIKIDISTDKQV